jgi:peroxiredoxin family protein
LSEPQTIEKVAIVVSKGSLEGVYPALIMANGARMDGIEADLFFTFFGLDAIRKDRYEKIKVATVGNPGLHMPTLLGALPGFSGLVTKMMQRQMEKIDIPPIPEFIELVHGEPGADQSQARNPTSEEDRLWSVSHEEGLAAGDEVGADSTHEQAQAARADQVADAVADDRPGRGGGPDERQ